MMLAIIMIMTVNLQVIIHVEAMLGHSLVKYLKCL